MPDDDRPRQVHEVRLQPSQWRFEVPAGVPLLRAARQAGITLPSSCRNGTCRTCLCRLVEGRVTYRIEWPGLSREEKDEGFILPCVAHAESDLLIDAPRAERRAADLGGR